MNMTALNFITIRSRLDRSIELHANAFRQDVVANACINEWWSCSVVQQCKLRDSPAVQHSIYAAAVVVCLCLHCTYLSYMSDSYFVYVILPEHCSLYGSSTLLSNLLLLLLLLFQFMTAYTRTEHPDLSTQINIFIWEAPYKN